jgi:pimeloyl-ACP methyl ester carboxylesterase
MAPENVREFAWAEAGEAIVRRELEREYREMVERVARDPSTILGPIEISASDRVFLAHPEVMRAMTAMVPEMCACGVDGWIDDDLAFLAPWGFALASIRVPVLVHYGRKDVLAPPTHGDWLAANVPNATVRADEATGHMGTNPLQNLREDIAWLREGIAPS